MKVGFIGLGNAGLPIASNLLKAGNELIVFDLRDERVKLMVEQGAQAGASPGDVASRSEVSFTSLPHPRVSEEVYLDEKGILARAGVGAVCVELSTISVSLVGKIAEAARARRVEYMDAGVAGGVARAIKGTLTLMVGGRKAAVEKVRPLFEAIAERIFHVGEVGAGMTVKVINNQMSHVNMIAICEGVAMGVKAGIAPEKLFEVISVSSGNSHQLHDRYEKRILKRDFAGGMKLELAYKDSELACELGRDLGIPLYVTNAAHAVYEHAKAKGIVGEDYASIIKLWEEILGVEIKWTSKPH